MPSLTDVARVAGVSLTTASMVLNKGKQESRVSEACAKRVREVATRLGYVPNYHARSMKIGRAEVLAVALDIGEPDIDNPANVSELAGSYFSQIVGGIELYTRSIGYQLMIVGPDASYRATERGLLGLKQRRFDGLVILGTVIDVQSEFMRRAPESPIVAIEYRGDTPIPVIDFNESAAMKLAIAHLGEFGHKNLLWVGPADDDDEPVHHREEAFLDAAREADMKTSACRFEEVRGANSADLIDRVASTVQSHLARGTNFTGVVCCNDKIAIGACDALMRAGLSIPKDVSVIGIDDTEASLCIPRLTSISHQLHEMGRRAAELALEMSSDPFAMYRYRGSRHVVEPSLVVRSSTGPAKKS